MPKVTTNSAPAKTFEHAGELLAKGSVSKSKLNGFHVSILRGLCKAKRLEVAASGAKGQPIKPDFVEALHVYVSIICRETCNATHIVYPNFRAK
jgi:hypothetical protein